MVKRIACFLTCGYTESGAMQAFLSKINNHYEYKQFLPNKTIKKKGMAKTIDKEISGLTGEKLLLKVYSIIEAHKGELAEFSAILIEDDLDGRFQGWDEVEINQYNQAIKNKIKQKMGKDIPVFIVYASPEIESWFVADWDNGFGFLYCYSGFVTDVRAEARKFYAYHLRLYINRVILGQYENDIENYGFFEGRYVKLSDKIIDALQNGFREYIESMSGISKKIVLEIQNSRCLCYSKKSHGQNMLRNIIPQNMLGKCCRYFKGFFYELEKFNG